MTAHQQQLLDLAMLAAWLVGSIALAFAGDRWLEARRRRNAKAGHRQGLEGSTSSDQAAADLVDAVMQVAVQRRSGGLSVDHGLDRVELLLVDAGTAGVVVPPAKQDSIAAGIAAICAPLEPEHWLVGGPNHGGTVTVTVASAPHAVQVAGELPAFDLANLDTMGPTFEPMRYLADRYVVPTGDGQHIELVVYTHEDSDDTDVGAAGWAPWLALPLTTRAYVLAMRTWLLDPPAAARA